MWQNLWNDRDLGSSYDVLLSVPAWVGLGSAEDVSVLWAAHGSPIHPSAIAFCFQNPWGQDRPQFQPHWLMLGCKPASSAFCFWGLMTGKMHFWEGLIQIVWEGGAVCAWCGTEPMGVIPFSVSVALSESFLWSVNLNVIAWPNHYTSGFVGVFSFKADAVQGYLLYSFMEELIEVNLPLSSQNAPRGTGFVLVCSLLGSAKLWSWVAAQPSSLWLPEASLCTGRVPGLARGTSGTSASGQGHSIAAAPSVTCPFTWVSILLFSKWKMFLYFTCWPENVRFSLQMTWRCLKYILSLMQKICIGLFFKCVF